MYMCDPPRIYPSLPEYTSLFSNYMRPSQNLPLPPRISPFQQMYMCDPPRIYPSLPEYTSLFNNYMRSSQNIPLHLRIYPPFQQIYICATLPEYTPPYQNTPPFSTTKCDPLRISPPLPEYTPLFNNYIIMRHSQNLSLPVYTPFFVISVFESQNPPSLPEYTPFSTNLYVRPSQNLPNAPSQNILPFSTNLYVRLSQNLPLPPRIYSPFKKMYICDPPRIYLSVPEHTPPPFHQLYATLSESTPPRIYHPFQQMYTCDPPRISPLSEYTPFQQLCATLRESTPPS